MSEKNSIVKKIVESLNEDPEKIDTLLKEKVIRIGKRNNQTIYRDLLKLFTHLDFDTKEAKEHWKNIFKHKLTLTRKIQRPVPLKVAMLDYFMKITPKLKNPKIIELDAFQRLADSTITDELTLLYNRRFFNETCFRELERVKRYNQPLSLLMLDLDDFKKYNDTFGHLCGDRILFRVGRLIKENCRNVDYPCRYGGEEFAIIFPQTTAAGALKVGQRIRTALSTIRFRTAPSVDPISLTLSGGVAAFENDKTTVEDLVNKADTALYRAKNEGKDRIYVYFIEKRKFLRVDTEVPIVYRILKNGEARKVKIRNIGGGGILFTVNENIPVGTPLELKIKLPDLLRSIKTSGRVVWNQRTGPESFELGFCFNLISPSDQEAIINYVEKIKSAQN